MSHNVNALRSALVLFFVLSATQLLTFCKEEKAPEPVGVRSMPAEFADGKALFETNNCNGCHGDMGMGNGPAGQALNPKPRNFRDISAYRKGSSEDQIANMLEFGLEGSPMKGYPHLSLAQRKQIAKYVVWLQKQR